MLAPKHSQKRGVQIPRLRDVFESMLARRYLSFNRRLMPMENAVNRISAASFIAVAWLVGGYNARIGRVVVADILAVACLVVGAVVEWRLRQAR